MGPREVMKQLAAWRAYDAWLSDNRIAFLDEPAQLERLLREHSQLSVAAPKDWADSYLAAFALASQLTLVTFDRSLAARAPNFLLLAR